jgi:diadenylate cyclase
VEEVFAPLINLFRDFSVRNLVQILDILLVAFLVYRLLALVRGTRAWRILFGIAIFLMLLFLSNYFQLHTLHFLLDRATLLMPVALVILFFPELRRALEGVGKVGVWTEKFAFSGDVTVEGQTVEELVGAAAEMSASRIGALIVLERTARLDEVIGNGVRIDARVAAPLLVSVFYSGNPLHDGAVVIRGDKVVSAACRLPLSENPRLDPSLHMRHRAAVGVTEAYDCLVIVVSEERGTISVATDGKLHRLANHVELRDVLNKELRDMTGDEEDKPKRGLFARSRNSK